MAPKILVVDDDPSISDMLTLVLETEGFDPVPVMDGNEAVPAFREHQPDLILLDLMLPGMNGVDICRAIRQESSVPIVMLTAKTDTVDVVLGLESGADDYITKPFSIEELLARIRTALRKQVKQESAQLTYGPLSLDVLRHLVTVESDTVELTGREFSLLQSLLENQGIVMTRETLMDRVWGYDFVGETNLVDVYIRYLRAKIAEKTDKKLIQTVRGVGYVLREEEGA